MLVSESAIKKRIKKIHGKDEAMMEGKKEIRYTAGIKKKRYKIETYLPMADRLSEFRAGRDDKRTSSVTQLCPTLCDPTNCVSPARLLCLLGFSRQEYWGG